MSDFERRKVILALVKNCENNPVNIFHYIYMEYGIDILEDVSEEDAYHVLCDYLDKEDMDQKYYWFKGRLYKEYSSKGIDTTYHREARLINSDCIKLDCTWFNGEEDFQKVAGEALKDLKERLDKYE